MNRRSISPFSDKKLESLDIVFENCEFYTVPADGINRMSIGEISSSLAVHFNGLSKGEEPGALLDWFCADYISLTLNEKGMNIHSCWEEIFDSRQLLKDRIKGQDITNFDLNFTDNTHLYIEVPWKDEVSERKNKYQHTDVKEKFAFINISKDINEEEFRKENNDLYDFETFEPKIDYSESIKNGNFDNIEIFTIDDEDDDVLNVSVGSINTQGVSTRWISIPNYVQAAFSKIDEQLSRVMWNIYQKEFDSPFDNTGNKFKNDVFEVEAYSWDDEYNQEYNFKWKDYKVRWYKHSRRDPEANRFISPEECTQMLDECLESIIKMDNDNDLLSEVHYCCQCGEETNYKELQNKKWACKNCLNNLGKEQHKLKEELENSLFEFGFDNYEDVTNCIDQFIDVLKYAKHNTTIETLEHLITGLEAININIKLENGLLDDETSKKIEEILKNW